MGTLAQSSIHLRKHAIAVTFRYLTPHPAPFDFAPLRFLRLRSSVGSEPFDFAFGYAQDRLSRRGRGLYKTIFVSIPHAGLPPAPQGMKMDHAPSLSSPIPDYKCRGQARSGIQGFLFLRLGRMHGRTKGNDAGFPLKACGNDGFGVLRAIFIPMTAGVAALRRDVRRQYLPPGSYAFLTQRFQSRDKFFHSSAGEYLLNSRGTG